MYLVLIGAECGQHYRRRRKKHSRHRVVALICVFVVGRGTDEQSEISTQLAALVEYGADIFPGKRIE